jgi:hypothetical protein
VTPSGQTISIANTAADWSLAGNVTGCSASPCATFLGATDNSAIEFRVNNLRAYRIEPATAHSTATFSPNVIGGFSGNNVTAGAGGATIAGGGDSVEVNAVYDDFDTVGGGRNNVAGLVSSPLGGRTDATVAGGHSNIASSIEATVGGGGQNEASGLDSVVGGGGGNTASGSYSTVPGGISNFATGTYSFAAGCAANANFHTGAFVWGDGTCNGPAATADNQFIAVASGGFYLYSNSGRTAGVTLAAGGGSWSAVSDRNVKDHLAAVDGREVLQRVLALPVASWNYVSQDPSIRHIGPMAQDFYAAFHVGEDDRHITQVDEGGVALAAIQGLNQKLMDELAKTEAEVSELKARIAQLERAVAQRTH